MHTNTGSQRKKNRLTLPECCPEGLPDCACWTDVELTEWFRLSVDYRKLGEGVGGKGGEERLEKGGGGSRKRKVVKGKEERGQE